MGNNTAQHLWDDVSRRLREELPDAAYSAWFGTARAVDLDGQLLTIAVPNEFTRAWIAGHFGDLVERAASETRDELDVRFAVEVLAASEAETGSEVEASARPVMAPASLPHPAAPPPERERFLPKYTFDSFVIGSSNRFPHAASLAVAEAPGQAYNPLLIYGGTGLGKTHLLQAIGAYVTRHTAGLRAAYVTSEAFTNDFIDALRDKRMDTFKHRYRASYDVLLVDDVQFLAGRERIQEEFFHTFNALHQAGRQVVLTCDRPVREIAGLEDRLRSRFEWGLITDVQPPDLETRVAILRKRVAADRVAIADPSVLTTIAQRVTTNIRELEGALTRVLAFASLTGRPVSPELVREVLHDLEGSLGEPSIDAIQALVAETFGISVADLCSARRSQAIVHPRQIAMYLTRELTSSSLPAIGRAFGGRDHTTVLYAVNRIAARMQQDRHEYNLVRDLLNRAKRGL